MAGKRDGEPQCAGAALMIRPARFGSNPETLESNRFQQAAGPPHAAGLARAEFDALAAALTAASVEVVVVEDTPEPAKPDACFPNNWLSTHADGSVVLYPMMAPSRRAERRDAPIAALEAAGFEVARRIDLSPLEARDEFLEGTGSLVLDRCHRVAYACRSPRTTRGALAEFSARLGYRMVVFDAHGADGTPVYHTNVLMAIGEGFSVLCAPAIGDPRQRARVARELARAGHEPIEIGLDEMHRFAGNVIALRARDGVQVIAASETAWQALSPAARERLAGLGRIVTAPIPTIEELGGGSVRCMIAEVFLPRPDARPTA